MINKRDMNDSDLDRQSQIVYTGTYGQGEKFWVQIFRVILTFSSEKYGTEDKIIILIGNM